MNRQIITLLTFLMISLSFGCAKESASEYSSSTSPTPEIHPIEFNVNIKKDSKINASFKSPATEFSAELKSDDELPDFYAKFKDEISKSSDSKIFISTEIPANLKLWVKLRSHAENAGVNRFYLKSEGKIMGSDFEKEKTDPTTKSSKPSPSSSNKPNPFILVVSVDRKGNIRLNNEEQGSFDDLSGLENRLTQVFIDRKKLNIFREGTNEVETTVYIRIPAETSAFNPNLEKLTEALTRAGASPIQIGLDEK